MTELLRRSAHSWGLAFLLSASASLAQPAPPSPPGPGGAPSIDQQNGSTMPRREMEGPPPGDMPGGGRPNADPVAMLINSSRLQAELKIDKTQLRELTRIEGPFLTRRAEIMQRMRDDPKQAEAARSELRAHLEMGRAMVARVLTPPQLDRLQQIMMQVGGVCVAVHDENVSLALSIDPSQMRRIATACEKMREAVMSVPRNASPKAFCAAFMEGERAYEAKRGEVDAEVAGILSEAQLASLKAMEGESFQIDPPYPPQCR